MTKTRENLVYFDGTYGMLTVVDDGVIYSEIETTRAHHGQYIRINDGRQYPQICEGGALRGNTLEWHGQTADELARNLARDCRARLFKTRAGYDRARARLEPAFA